MAPMRRRCIVFLVLLKVAFASLIGCSAESETSETALSYPSSNTLRRLNSLVPPVPKEDVVLVVDIDGKISLVERNSMRTLWSWSSGQSIYSSYQNIPERAANSTEPIDDFFIDCDDDWKLYFHRNGKKQDLLVSVEDFVRGTPHVAEDGGVTLGSRKTTVLLVNATSGKLVHTFNLPDSRSDLGALKFKSNNLMLKEKTKEFVESGGEELKSVDQPLYILRTDYTLQHQSSVNGQVVWSVSFSDFDASFQFPGSENALGSVLRKVKPALLRIRDRSLMDSLYLFDRKVHELPGGKPLPLPAHKNSLNPIVLREVLEASETTKGIEVLALPPSETDNSSILAGNGNNIGEIVFMSAIAETISRYHMQYRFPYIFTVLFVAAGIVLYLVSRRRSKLSKISEELKVQAGGPKKKKNRKIGNKKNNVNNEKRPSYSSDDLSPDRGSNNISLPSFANIGDGSSDGRKIGKLVVSSQEIAHGSNGTIILEGIYDGRSVAVKRLVRTHHDIALKEIQNLIASDQHPNVVRWYGVEYDQDFVYLSLERCTCSLNDLIYMYGDSFQTQAITKDHDSEILDNYTLRLHKIKENNKEIELWKSNGQPTLQLLKLMRDIVSGVAHLHELGIVHRDLKPQNVLISKDRVLRAKLSDMGISKRLPGDMSSLTMHTTGYGSSGWQAPEQLLRQRQTRAVDLFSLGCVLFFCVTGGKHPYGDNIERDVNIVNDRKDLFLVDSMPEAVDLFTRLLDPDPSMRPKAVDVLDHPFFWSAETRLSFLRDASDRVEFEDRENDSELLDALESVAGVALRGKWDEKMEPAFINNIGRYRRYKYDSIRDLLRVVRNKLNHYRELPPEIQELLGPVPEGFDGYFATRFPRLLMEVFNVISRHCRDEEFFLKYTASSLK